MTGSLRGATSLEGRRRFHFLHGYHACARGRFNSGKMSGTGCRVVMVGQYFKEEIT